MHTNISNKKDYVFLFPSNKWEADTFSIVEVVYVGKIMKLILEKQSVVFARQKKNIVGIK